MSFLSQRVFACSEQATVTVLQNTIPFQNNESKHIMDSCTVEPLHNGYLDPTYTPPWFPVVTALVSDSFEVFVAKEYLHAALSLAFPCNLCYIHLSFP